MQAMISRRRFLAQSSKSLLAAGLTGGAMAGGSTLLSACGGGQSSTQGPVEITYTYPASLDALKDIQSVQDAINAILKPEINTTLKLNPIDSSAFDQKMKLAFAAGQNVGDIVFTASWTNNYYQNVANRNLIAIDDLLPKYAPGLYASMPASTWNAARVGGKLYAVINQQLFPQTFGVNVKKDLADKYHLNLDTINGYADLTPFLAAVKAGSPDIIPWWTTTPPGEGGQTFFPQIYGWDPVFDVGGADIVIRYDDANLRVFHVYSTPEYRQTADLVYNWHQMGYTTKDASQDATTQRYAGKYATWSDQYRPGLVDPTITYQTVGKSFCNPPFLNTYVITATMNAITRSCQHPQQAMQVLEMFNTNTQVYNLMCFGIEGKHYVFTNQAKGVVALPSGITAENDAYNPDTDWMFGNQFNAYYRYGSEADIRLWDIQQQMNQTAALSKALGFAFDPSAVQSQIAAVSAVTGQYRTQFANGMANPAVAMPAFLSKLQTAGIDQIVAEVQKQINSWASSKK